MITASLLVLGSAFMFKGVMGSLIQVAGVALWILLMVKAYQGEKFKLPVVGDLAEQLEGRYRL